MNNCISRSEAQAKGLKKFFTGMPCIKGHMAERNVSNNRCVICNRETVKHRYHQQKTIPHYLAKRKERQRRYDWRRQGVVGKPTRPRPDFCECCSRKPNGKGVLHLDHDHSTGLFRGWLCFDCNRGLGSFGDTEDGVLRALYYLRAASVS